MDRNSMMNQATKSGDAVFKFFKMLFITECIVWCYYATQNSYNVTRGHSMHVGKHYITVDSKQKKTLGEMK